MESGHVISNIYKGMFQVVIYIFIFIKQISYRGKRGKRFSRDKHWWPRYWNQEHFYHSISSTGDVLFRQENVSIILSSFIIVTWSKPTIRTKKFWILKVCSISSLFFGFKLVHKQTIHLQRKRMINLFKALS